MGAHVGAAAPGGREARRVGEIPVPPKYTSADFLRVRRSGVCAGKLDVPKERFISYPYCRARRRPDAGDRLGRLGPPAAGAGAGRVLRAHEGAGRLGAGAAHSRSSPACSNCCPG